MTDDTTTARLLTGDCRAILPTLPDGSVQCCITSPPYFGLRDYGHAAQIGLEPTPDAYVAEMVSVFREVRRVLADDGVLFLNLGDSYAGSGKGGNPDDSPHKKQRTNAGSLTVVGQTARDAARTRGAGDDRLFGAKPKDLLGIPWRVAFALQADGWYLRADIIWHKPNPMPESVTDRPTKAHEYVFLLTKSARYFYDAAAISEPSIHAGRVVKYDGTQKNSDAAEDPRMRTRIAKTTAVKDTRNVRSVWTISTKPYKGAHFATMPPDLAERCILAGSRRGDTVLDPFSGSGTTAAVAVGHGRNAIGIEANAEYQRLAVERIGPMLVTVEGDA